MPEDVDKPLGFLGLVTGETPLLVQRRPEQTDEPREELAKPSRPGEPQTSGGVIYTKHTMPSLAQLLEEQRVATAVLLGEAESPDAWRLVVATSLAAGITVAGAVLTVLSLLAKPSQPDPFVGVTLLFGGLGLFATLVVALRRGRENAS